MKGVKFLNDDLLIGFRIRLVSLTACQAEVNTERRNRRRLRLAHKMKHRYGRIDTIQWCMGLGHGDFGVHTTQKLQTGTILYFYELQHNINLAFPIQMAIA